jgi:hypothetical protein
LIVCRSPSAFSSGVWGITATVDGSWSPPVRGADSSCGSSLLAVAVRISRIGVGSAAETARSAKAAVTAAPVISAASSVRFVDSFSRIAVGSAIVELIAASPTASAREALNRA